MAKSHKKMIERCEACGRSALNAGFGLCPACYRRAYRLDGATFPHAEPRESARCETIGRMSATAPSVGVRDDDLVAEFAGVPPMRPLYLTPPIDTRASKRIVLRHAFHEVVEDS